MIPCSSQLTPEIVDELRHALGERVQFDVIVAPLMAYQIGGPADALVLAADESDLSAVSQIANRHGLPVTVLGHGTNLLVSDSGIRGITISLKSAFQHIRILSEADKRTLIEVGAGVSKSDLLNWAMDRGLSGLEFSSGVPGTLGGGIYMNAGTKYGCYGDVLEELRLFNLKDGFRNMNRKELYFGYREQTAVGRDIVVSMVFALSPGDASAIRTEVNRILEERAERQPLDKPSCGSTFKNPPTGLSAGRLIERAGLKGTQIGGAQISTKHANFILNQGSAKAQDILDLIALVQSRVRADFQVELETEVILVGDLSTHTVPERTSLLGHL